jgi:hypothetical protein
VRLEAFDFSNLHYKVHRYRRKCFLPAFAESPVRKGGDECEKGIHRSLGEGGSASAGSAEDVKMARAPVLRRSATAEGGAARGASLSKVRMELRQCGGRDHEALCLISGQAEHIPLGHLSLPFEDWSSQCRVENTEGFKIHFIEPRIFGDILENRLKICACLFSPPYSAHWSTLSSNPSVVKSLPDSAS